MPDEQSSSCDELPLGLTQVIAADWLMPSAAAVCRLTSTAIWRSWALTCGILGDRAVHLAGDIHAQQPLFVAVLLPLRPQAGEIGRHRLDACR